MGQLRAYEWDLDPRTVALRERIACLEYEIEEARGGPGSPCDPHSQPWGLALTPCSVRLVWLLARRAPMVLGFEGLRVAIAPHGREEVSRTMLRNHVFNARRGLARLGLELCIARDQGYFMSKADGVKWLAWIEARAAGEAVPTDYPLRVTFHNRHGWVVSDHG